MMKSDEVLSSVVAGMLTNTSDFDTKKDVAKAVAYTKVFEQYQKDHKIPAKYTYNASMYFSLQMDSSKNPTLVASKAFEFANAVEEVSKAFAEEKKTTEKK